jgi:phosphatidylglycerophosphatase A
LVSPEPARRQHGSPWTEIPKTALASGLGLGLSPIGPGTLAALLGVGVDAAVTTWLPAVTHRPLLLAALVLVAAGNHWLTPFAVWRWKNPDPRQFVLDEVAGYLLVAALFREPPHVVRIVVGFLLVRVLDIVKVPPARCVDRHMHGATGILLDDLIAGLYAVALLCLGWLTAWAFGLS